MYPAVGTVILSPTVLSRENGHDPGVQKEATSNPQQAKIPLFFILQTVQKTIPTPTLTAGMATEKQNPFTFLLPVMSGFLTSGKKKLNPMLPLIL